MKYYHNAIKLQAYYRVRKTLSRIQAENAIRLLQTKRFHSQMFQLFPEAQLILEKGRIVAANPAALRLFAASHSEQLCGRSLLELALPEVRSALAARLQVAGAAEPAVRTGVEAYQRLDGSVAEIATWEIALPFPGRVLWFGRAAAAAGGAQVAPGSGDQRFQDLFHSLGDPVILCDIAKPFLIREVNATACQTLGYAREELLGQPSQLIIAPEWRAQAPKIAQRLQENGKICFETVHQCRDGARIPVEVNGLLLELDGRPLLLAVARDISERKKMEAKLKKLTFNDQVTGVYNRAFLEEELKKLDKQNSAAYGVILGDINGLKLVNDTFGHETGDRFLRRAAKLLQEACDKADLIARWGGDEFAIVVPDPDVQAIERLCRRIRKRFLSSESQPVTLSIALGFAVKETPNQTYREVLKEADERMYRNKLLEQNKSYNSLLVSLQTDLAGQYQETDEHSRRLKELAQRMGEVLDLSMLEKDNLALLATLHDIGKVAVPSSILGKPGPLTPLEFDIIQKHPEVGYRIAKLYLNHIAEGILTHHERWDGTGYPLGLKGEQIPLISRIIAIVDAFDAMTHDRVYRKALRLEDALTEIARNSGSQFDPQLVQIFLNFFDQPVPNVLLER
jgi:diguanylate cyclase (GGDEF)-like protein/PAS domain S-box-containing protein